MTLSVRYWRVHGDAYPSRVGFQKSPMTFRPPESWDSSALKSNVTAFSFEGRLSVYKPVMLQGLRDLWIVHEQVEGELEQI